MILKFLQKFLNKVKLNICHQLLLQNNLFLLTLTMKTDFVFAIKQKNISISMD